MRNRVHTALIFELLKLGIGCVAYFSENACNRIWGLT